MTSVTTLLILGFVLRTVIGLRQVLNGTTARSAAGWGIAACCAAITSVSMRFVPAFPEGVVSAAHSLAAALMLTPLIDILGARRPGHRVWPWFVVIPMVVVLAWPAASHLFSEHLETPVTIPVPACIGFVLILVMGTGNFFGTANTTACLFGAASVVLFWLPVTELSAWPGHSLCLSSSICLALAALLIEGRHSIDGTQVGHENLWVDFRDIYGIVWARRVMDRINQFADRERWKVRMTLNGFQPCDGSPQPIEIDDTRRPEEILRWLLRRFVDDEFVDRYLRTEDTR